MNDLRSKTSAENAKKARKAAMGKWAKWHSQFESRFWSRVAKGRTEDCWPWKMSINKRGYGQFTHKRKVTLAHRAAYELTHGTIAKNKRLCVCHKCDNRPCCNPSHLFLGTDLDNLTDCIKKGRFKFAPSGEKSPAAKLTESQVQEIRRIYKPYITTCKMIAQRFGVSRSTVQSIIEGNTWKHVHKRQ